MDIARVNQLAMDLDVLHQLRPDRFNMSKWGDGELFQLLRQAEEDLQGLERLEQLEYCNTAGCIAGWTHFLYDDVEGVQSPSDFAQGYLGLDDDTAQALFLPKDHVLIQYGLTYADITAEHAAMVLRYLAVSGEVSWSGLG